MCENTVKQCQEYHRKLLPEFERVNTQNLSQRLDKIETIVNAHCEEYNLLNSNTFKICSMQRDRLTALCNKDLSEHTFVSVEKCVKTMNNINIYRKIARNKLNRWKPKVYGQHVLYQIIYINIYNYCLSIGRCQEWDDVNISSLFIEIFCKLLTEKIRFPKTRDVPLIMPTALQENTKFRSSCIHHLQHFDMLSLWNQRSGRAGDKRDSFIQCLQRIQNETINMQNIAIPPPIIMDLMDIDDNNRECKVVYKHIVHRFILQFEDEEMLNMDERISTAYDSDILINIINEYIHYRLTFWTFTPQQQSTFTMMSFMSFHDINTNQVHNMDQDGDIRININGSNSNRNFAALQTTNSAGSTLSDSPCGYTSGLTTTSSTSHLTGTTPTSSLDAYQSANPSQSQCRGPRMFRESSNGSVLSIVDMDKLPQLNDNNGDSLFCNQSAMDDIHIAGQMDVESNPPQIYQPEQQQYNFLQVPSSRNPHITQQLPRPQRTGYNYQPRRPQLQQQLPPPPSIGVCSPFPVLGGSYPHPMHIQNDNNSILLDVNQQHNNFNQMQQNENIFDIQQQQQQGVSMAFTQSNGRQHVDPFMQGNVNGDVSFDGFACHDVINQPQSIQTDEGQSVFPSFIGNDNGNDSNGYFMDNNMNDINNQNQMYQPTVYNNTSNEYNGNVMNQFDDNYMNQQPQSPQLHSSHSLAPPHQAPQQGFYQNSNSDNNCCVEAMQMDSAPNMVYQSDVNIVDQHSNHHHQVHLNQIQNTQSSQTMMFNNNGTEPMWYH